jgi:hypothetical protein
VPPSGGGGQVLGVTTTTQQACSEEYIHSYIHIDRPNDPTDVKKLQQFLNRVLGTDLPITGFYGPRDEQAVREFQVKFHHEVLLPWVPYGLPDEMESTGYVYKTTKRWINLIMCHDLNLPIPPLP